MDRFTTREPGRQTRHSFSFGSSYDPERVAFGPLVALNDDLLAAGVVSTLPVLIAFFVTQRWLIKGITAGAVKG